MDTQNPSSEGPLQVRIFLITGDPASGKTTVVSKLLFRLRSKGLTIGGILTREVRIKGERTGFRLIDASTEESSLLASSEGRAGPKVGKYRIDLKALGTLAPKALDRARERSDVIVCDEIGPMELFSPEFRRGVENSVINSKKPCICVIHKRLTDPLIDSLKAAQDSKLYEVTFENRSTMTEDIWQDLKKLLEKEELIK